MPEPVRLFIKPWCGWCHEAIEWLDARSVRYQLLDVTRDAAAREEMVEISGQSLTPTIDVDGRVLADFDTDQLESFWRKLQEEQK